MKQVHVGWGGCMAENVLRLPSVQKSPKQTEHAAGTQWITRPTSLKSFCVTHPVLFHFFFVFFVLRQSKSPAHMAFLQCYSLVIWFGLAENASHNPKRTACSVTSCRWFDSIQNRFTFWLQWNHSRVCLEAGRDHAHGDTLDLQPSVIAVFAPA